jgi:hypothetical protein
LSQLDLLFIAIFENESIILASFCKGGVRLKLAGTNGLIGRLLLNEKWLLALFYPSLQVIYSMVLL